MPLRRPRQPLRNVPFDFLALDAGARSYDQDGRLRVRVSHVSKACVNPYNGREIPYAEELGLDPNKVYKLLRDPEELAKSAPTWNGVPLLITHRPLSANDHQRNITVGSLGTDAVFRAPYLDNSLMIWDGQAIAAIESGEQRQLSGGYHYTADMTPGVWNGIAYDGVMRDIRGNHVALVETGRAGSDVLVMDSALNAQPRGKHMRKKAAAVKPRAAVAKGAGNTNEMTLLLAKAIRPMLAQDATLADLDRMIDALSGGEASVVPEEMAPEPELGEVGPEMRPEDGEVVSQNPDDTGLGDPEDTNATAKDDDLEDKVRELLAGKLDDADFEMLMKLISPADPTDVVAPPPVEPADPPPDAPSDLPSPFAKNDDDDGAKTEVHVHSSEKNDDDDKAKDRGFARDRLRRGRDALPPSLKENQVDKPAMDAAIKAATTAAVADAIKETTKRLDARSAAERFVRPWIGEVTVAMDSADEVYRTALEALGVETKNVHPSAFRTILSHMPKPGEAAPRLRVAMDAAGAADFATRFPGAARLRVVG